MLLTITATASDAAVAAGRPATDLGYLLHKHPDRAQGFELSVGLAHVFYPEATARRCTAALLLEVDPIALVRNRRFGGSEAFSLAQYVNDRPYAASSMLAVALGRVFRTALSGRCDLNPELAEQPLNLDLGLPALPCRGGIDVAREVFEPLGWQVEATELALEAELGWGTSRYLDLRLAGELRLAEALNQLYVLLPVLDDAKHYWVGPDEVDKLIRAGSGWLGGHPQRALITERYLRHARSLVATATDRLAELDGLAAPEEAGPDEAGPDEAARGASRTSLAALRIEAVLAALKACRASSVLDLGCGEGKLLRALLAEPGFTRIEGVDVSSRTLELAAKRLHLEQLPDRARERITLRQSSLTYRDAALAGFDAAVLMEVIEHVDPPRLDALERNVFGQAHPQTVVVTTPNVEHNTRFGLPAGARRHPDHRFEWSRAEFRGWAQAVAGRHGYLVRFEPVGPDDADAGPPSQLAVFTLAGPERSS